MLWVDVDAASASDENMRTVLCAQPPPRAMLATIQCARGTNEPPCRARLTRLLTRQAMRLPARSCPGHQEEKVASSCRAEQSMDQLGNFTRSTVNSDYGVCLRFLWFIFVVWRVFQVGCLEGGLLPFFDLSRHTPTSHSNPAHTHTHSAQA